MRLDRFTANASGLSRSQVHRLIKSGDVLLNGAIGRYDTPVGPSDAVTLNGLTIVPSTHVYLALHKPTGYICATEDGDHPTVLDLVRENALAQHPTEALQVVGRLDLDTTGLILITTDGQWNHRITSPSGKCHKTYDVTLAEPISDEHIAILESGIRLRSETKSTRPCVIRRLNSAQVTIQLSEGKYHQVKRMFAAVGNRVTRLHRLAIGQILLRHDQAVGQFRVLTDEEVGEFQ